LVSGELVTRPENLVVLLHLTFTELVTAFVALDRFLETITRNLQHFPQGSESHRQERLSCFVDERGTGVAYVDPARLLLRVLEFVPTVRDEARGLVFPPVFLLRLCSAPAALFVLRRARFLFFAGCAAIQQRVTCVAFGARRTTVELRCHGIAPLLFRGGTRPAPVRRMPHGTDPARYRLRSRERAARAPASFS